MGSPTPTSALAELGLGGPGLLPLHKFPISKTLSRRERGGSLRSFHKAG